MSAATVSARPPNALNEDGGPQDLYPHCLSCSRKQGGTIRQILRTACEITEDALEADGY